MVAISRPADKSISAGERLIRLTLANVFATLAGTLQAVERLAPDHFHASDSHLAELFAVLRDARNANRQKLTGARG